MLSREATTEPAPPGRSLRSCWPANLKPKQAIKDNMQELVFALSEEQKTFLKYRIANPSAKLHRSMCRVLQRFGFVDAKGRVTLKGHHSVGAYKNTPFVPVPEEGDWVKDADRNLVVAENYVFSNNPAFEPSIKINVRDMMELYTQIAIKANAILESDYWSRDMDEDVEAGKITEETLKMLQNMALKLASEDTKLSSHPLESICVPLAKTYLEDTSARYFQASASMRFAFDDCGWEEDAWVVRQKRIIRPPQERDFSKPSKIVSDAVKARERASKIQEHIQKAREAVPCHALMS